MPSDAVTHMLQDMYASTPSMGTLVIGLPTAISPISNAVLQNFANAGAGLPVVIPPGSGASSADNIYYSCTGAGNGAWMALYTAAGRTGTTPLTTYSATGGNATVYEPR